MAEAAEKTAPETAAAPPDALVAADFAAAVLAAADAPQQAPMPAASAAEAVASPGASQLAPATDAAEPSLTPADAGVPSQDRSSVAEPAASTGRAVPSGPPKPAVVERPIPALPDNADDLLKVRIFCESSTTGGDCPLAV